MVQIALATQLPLRATPTAEILYGHGIVGDRYENARHRQVTVQSLEEIALAEEELGRPLDARLTRRNITVNMGLLDRTPGARLRLGTEDLGWIELEVVRDAAPCKILEDNLGRDAKLALHNVLESCAAQSPVAPSRWAKSCSLVKLYRTSTYATWRITVNDSGGKVSHSEDSKPLWW